MSSGASTRNPWGRYLLGLLLVVFWPAVASAQWVEFADETDAHFACGDQEGSNCTDATLNAFKNSNSDEKDYAWADLDGDGDIDFVAVHKQLGTTTGRRRNYLFMNEDGVLVDRTTQYASASMVMLADGSDSQGFLDLTNDRDVAIADVNGDDWLDVITSTTLSGSFGKAISHPRIYINLGDDPPGSGNWQGLLFDDEDRVPTMPYEPRFCSVSAGDVDGDNDLDLYFGDYIQGPYSRNGDLDNRLWINDGTGNFVDESTIRMTDDQRDVSFSMANALVDMNRDGALDVVIDDALSAPTAISIVYNDTDQEGFFNDMPREFIYNASPYHIAVGDLNNDEWMDIVITDDGQDRYMLSQGNGADGFVNFGTSQVLVGSDGNFGGNNWIADLNNDGFNDVLVSNVDVDLPSCSTSSKIFRNLGNLPNVSIQQQGNVGIPQSDLNGVHDWGVFDINEDGWLDLVIGQCSGTRIFMNQPPVGVVFNYPQGLPIYVVPGEEFSFQVQLTGVGGGEPAPGTGEIHLSVNGGPFDTFAMTDLGGGLYEATLPPGDCIDSYNFYFSGEEVGGGVFTDPSNAPTDVYNAVAAEGTVVTLSEDVEGDTSAWTVVNDPSLTSGSWEAAEPIGTIYNGDLAAPGEDAQASVETIMAFVTENCPSEPCDAVDYDVDGGPTDLISPTINLDGTDAVVSFFWWFYTSGQDALEAHVTNVADPAEEDWVFVTRTNNTTDGNNTVWENTSFLVSDYVEPTANVKVMFRANDTDEGSVVEGGVDLVQVDAFACGGNPADVNGDGMVNVEDLLLLLAAWGPCDCPEDVNGDGSVDVIDLLALLAAWS